MAQGNNQLCVSFTASILCTPRSYPRNSTLKYAFRCGSLTSNFISADLGSLPSEYNNKKVIMKCVDKDAAVVEQEEIPEVGPNGELPTRYDFILKAITWSIFNQLC